MEIAGVQSLELATATVTVGKGQPKVIVTNEGAIPAEYMRQQAPKPDLRAIGLALRDKIEVPGTFLSNMMPTLTVRMR